MGLLNFKLHKDAEVPTPPEGQATYFSSEEAPNALSIKHHSGVIERLGEAGPEGKEGKEGKAGKEGPEGKEGKAGPPVKLEAPGGETPREPETEYEPSASKDAIVVCSVKAKAAAKGKVGFYVGGTKVATAVIANLAEAGEVTVTFPVPAKSKWKYKVEEGEVTEVLSSYTLFGSGTEGGGGGLKQYSSYHATAVLATGESKATGALQAGEEDKVTFNVPAGGGYYELAASIVGKNPGVGYGGAILKVDGVAVKVSPEEPTTNVAACPSGSYDVWGLCPTHRQGESIGWRRMAVSGAGAEATPELGFSDSTIIFLPEGEHTVGLYLFNEDRGSGKVKERRLVVIGP